MKKFVTIAIVFALTMLSAKDMISIENSSIQFKHVNREAIENTGSYDTINTREEFELYYEDFEGETEWSGLDMTIPAGMWHTDDFDTPDGAGTAWWMGDPAIGGYIDHTYLTLDTPEILVPTGGHLTFDLTYNVEAPGGEPDGYDGWDGCNVRISTDGGFTWDVISGIPSYPSSSLYSFGFEHGEGEGIAGYTGNSNGWVSADFNLSGYAGQNVMVRFAFASDPGYNTMDDPSLYGMIVDNIALGDFFNDGVDDGTMVSGSQVPIAGDLWHVYEDESAPSPTHAVGCFDENTGTYNPGMEDYFVSPYITLPLGSDYIYYDFFYKAGIDEGDFPDADFLYVEVEYQGAWNSVSNPTGVAGQDNFVFTGSAEDWTTWGEAYGYNDMTILAGETIRFRVGLHSNADTPTTIGFHIDDFKVMEVSSVSYLAPTGLGGEALSGQVAMYWDDMNVSGTEDYIYDNDAFSADNGIVINGEGFAWAGETFEIAGNSTINSVSINNINDAGTAITIAAFSQIGSIYSSTPTYSEEVVMNDVGWNTFDVTGWDFEIGYLVAYTFSADISAALDISATPSAHSYVMLGAGWDDWATTASGAGLNDGEWGVRANISFSGANVTYNVYRDGEVRTTDLLVNEYTDYEVENNVEYEFAVSATYEDGTESALSDPITLMPESSTIYELSYDDGTSEIGLNAGQGNYLAVRFTAQGNDDLIRIKWFQIGDAGAFYLKMFDDVDGLPGDEIFSQIITGSDDGWNSYDMIHENMQMSGDFWVGVKEFSSTKPFGLDTDTDTGNGYFRIGGSGIWEPVSNMGTPGNLMFRVNLDAGEAPVYSVVLNEFLANSTNCCGPDNEDFIELYNSDSVDLDISGWGFTDSHEDELTFAPEGTVIPAGGYLVAWYTGDPDGWPEIDQKLGSSGDDILIQDAEGNIVISHTYDDSFDYDDVSANLLEDGTYALSVTPTPGEENVINGLSIDSDIPTELSISQAYPNPFNPSTTIGFTLPSNDEVTVNVYDITGKMIDTISQTSMTAGYHTVVWNADAFTSGVYFIEVKASDVSKISKVMLIK